MCIVNSNQFAGCMEANEEVATFRGVVLGVVGKSRVVAGPQIADGDPDSRQTAPIAQRWYIAWRWPLGQPT